MFAWVHESCSPHLATKRWLFQRFDLSVRMIYRAVHPYGFSNIVSRTCRICISLIRCGGSVAASVFTNGTFPSPCFVLARLHLSALSVPLVPFLFTSLPLLSSLPKGVYHFRHARPSPFRGRFRVTPSSPRPRGHEISLPLPARQRTRSSRASSSWLLIIGRDDTGGERRTGRTRTAIGSQGESGSNPLMR